MSRQVINATKWLVFVDADSHGEACDKVASLAKKGVLVQTATGWKVDTGPEGMPEDIALVEALTGPNKVEA